MNNFKDYGFEANFEGEILSDIKEYYIGYYIETYPFVKEKQKIPTFWNKNTGNCYKGAGISNSKYNLTKVKLKWYEIKDNVGKILLYKKFNILVTFQATLGENIRVEHMSNYYLLKIDELELLTEDTIKYYLVKE